MDFLSAPRSELIHLVYDLIDENRALKSQIAELKSRLEKQGPKDKGALPSFVKPNSKHKRKKIRKIRVMGFGRARSVPTKQLFHSYEVCPTCCGQLGKPSVAYTREVIDIPLSSVEIAEHVVFKRWCTNCGKRYYPKVSLNSVTVGRQRFGLNLMALVNTLREQCSQPLNKIKQYLNMIYQLNISEGALVRLLNTTAAHGKPSYEQIKQKIRASDVVYADETGGRENGANGYFWNFSNRTHQLLLYRKSRSKQIVREVLGDEEDNAFQGVLVTDFYASYNEYQGFHQRCGVHLLRDIDDLKKQHPKHPPLNKWAKHVKEIYDEAKSYSGPSPNLPLGLQAEERITKENYFKEKLRTLCEPYVTKDVPQSTLCARVITYLSELFTFVRFPNVDFDNNRAERAIRHLVVSRKISGGTRSAKGSETKSILASLFGTWRLQGLNPFEQTKLLLIRSPCQEM